MEQTIYAAFKTPDDATSALTDLVKHGASDADVAVITKHTYKDPAFNAEDDERIDVPEPIPLEPSSDGRHSSGFDPLGDKSDAVWLADRMRYPGDMAKGLKELGFDWHLAHNIEAGVLDGGAILMIRVPTGPIDKVHAWQLVAHLGGKAFTPAQTSSYLG